MGCGVCKESRADGIEARAADGIKREPTIKARKLSHKKSVEAVLARKPTYELGVTLEFLVTFLQDLDEGFFQGDGDFTTDDLVEKFIKHAVKETQCRYVDLIDQRFVKPPTVFVSHRWKRGFRVLVERLLTQFNYATDEAARHTSVWIDVFAVNQNQNAETKQDIDGFESVIQRTKITAFNLDEKCEELRRIWCLYEVWKTFAHRGVDSLLVMSQGIGALPLGLQDVFYAVDVANAKASLPRDVERILAEIKEESNFLDFNRKVREALLESTTRQVQSVGTSGEGGNADEQLASLHQDVAMLQTAGKFAEAVSVAQQQLELAKKAHGEGHNEVALALNNLANLNKCMGKYDDALPLFERSLAIREKVHHGEEHPEVATSLNNLALLYQKMGKYDDALPLFERSLAIDLHGEDHPRVASALNNLAELNRAMGKYDDALLFFERSLAIREKVHHGEEHPRPELALAMYSLVVLYHNLKRYREARMLSERASAIREKVLFRNVHPDTRTKLEWLDNIGRQLGIRGLTVARESRHTHQHTVTLTQRAVIVTVSSNLVMARRGGRSACPDDDWEAELEKNDGRESVAFCRLKTSA
eukprot:1185959-Prorocentrum_minimum.AAC.1